MKNSVCSCSGVIPFRLLQLHVPFWGRKRAWKLHLVYMLEWSPSHYITYRSCFTLRHDCYARIWSSHVVQAASYAIISFSVHHFLPEISSSYPIYHILLTHEVLNSWFIEMALVPLVAGYNVTCVCLYYTYIYGLSGSWSCVIINSIYIIWFLVCFMMTTISSIMHMMIKDVPDLRTIGRIFWLY